MRGHAQVPAEAALQGKELAFDRRYARFGVQGIADGALCFEGQILGISMPSERKAK